MTEKYDKDALENIYACIRPRTLNKFLQIELEDSMVKLENSLPNKYSNKVKNFVNCFPKLDDLFCSEITRNVISLQYRLPLDEFKFYFNTYEFKVIYTTDNRILFGLSKTRLEGLDKEYNMTDFYMSHINSATFSVDPNFDLDNVSMGSVSYMPTSDEPILATSTYPKGSK